MLSPLIGFVLGSLLMVARVAGSSCAATPRKVDHWFRRLQFVSASLYSLGHGGNDAQKTMGIICGAALFARGHDAGGKFHVPLWVVLSCQAAMALGTLFGGWRIVKTMGMKITKLKPVGGFCAETGGALTLFLATASGHSGVDHAHHHRRDRRRRRGRRKLSAVRWGVAGQIVWAWILTIPCTAFISGVTWWIAERAFIYAAFF